MAGIAPRQKLSKKEKTPEWFKENTNYLVEETNFYSDDRWEMISLYRAAQGILDSSQYRYVLNPYNSPNENQQNYPAMMRNWDIIAPLVKLFLGEKAEKPSNPEVLIANHDASNKAKESLTEALIGILAQKFVNHLNATGNPTGVPSQEVPEVDEVIAKNSNKYDDARAIFGQDAVDYIKYDLDLKDKYQTGFYDWLVVERVYTYKNVANDNLEHEIVPPLEIWHSTTRTGFIEDCDWVVRKSRYSLNKVLDKFNHVLGIVKDEDGSETDEIAFLESHYATSSVSATNMISMQSADMPTSVTTPKNLSNDGLIDVHHCVWKTFEEIGILTYRDELGQIQTMEVDASYNLETAKGDISLEKLWINRVLESYLIGEVGTGLYKYMQPLLVQREELGNSSICKLPYNGRCGYSERDKINSTVKTLVPYQAFLNVIHFRTELTIGRNKDKIMLMPKGLMPAGWDETKWLYFLEATSIAFFDETKPNAMAVLNAIKAIDLSLGNHIAELRNLIADIKNEAWDAVGVNRQRYGDVKASDGKGANEQAIFRSALISREVFRRFERFEEKDLDGLLDYSKVAWINGKKGMFVRSDGHKAFLEVNPEEHLGTEYNTFIKDSTEEQQKLQMAKQYAFGFAQKGVVKPSTTLEVIDSNNMSKLKVFIKRAEELEEKLKAQQQKAEQDHESQLAQGEANEGKLDRQNKIDVANIMVNGTMNSELIKADVAMLQMENAEEGSEKVDNSENENLENVRKSNIAKTKNRLDSYKAIVDERAKQTDQAIAREKIASAEKIAKQNKNKYDK